MKKIACILLISMGLWASPEGMKVYEKYCQACHSLQPPSTMAQRRAMKAPPMRMVVHRIRKAVGDEREKFVAFVTDYIQHPDRQKGVCMPRAYQRFGTMPPIGASMTPKERKNVAEWLFEHFEHEDGRWMGHGGMAKGCQMDGMSAHKWRMR